MKLRVATPSAVVVDAPDVVAIRAEDGSGHFGILPGHMDFLTVLEPSVITWRDKHGREHFVAVRGGILTVQGGRRVEVATREAVASDDLAALQAAVLASMRVEAQAEERDRAHAARLHAAFIQQMTRYLRSGPGTGGSSHGQSMADLVREMP
jgi:F-type H+-transporting ATPase subunit epsilon